MLDMWVNFFQKKHLNQNQKDLNMYMEMLQAFDVSLYFSYLDTPMMMCVCGCLGMGGGGASLMEERAFFECIPFLATF